MSYQSAVRLVRYLMIRGLKAETSLEGEATGTTGASWTVMIATASGASLRVATEEGCQLLFAVGSMIDAKEGK
jgi:hypothetical protein